MDLINIGQLEFLTKLGMQEDTVDICSTKFTFKTLSVDESTAAFEAPMKEKYEDDLAKFNSMRIEVLARAIMKINNISIPNTYKERIKILLGRSQQMVLNKLFEAYAKLMEKQEEKFKEEEKLIKEQTPSMPVEDINHLTQQTIAQVAPPQTFTDSSTGLEVPADEPINIVNPQQLFGKK